MLTFKKGDATKVIKEGSKLIPLLKLDGWILEEKPKEEKPKKKK